MAWQVRSTQDVGRAGDSAQIQVVVVYFDDADPATILHGPVTFNFPRDKKLADIRAEILSEGQNVRDAIAQVTALRAQFPAGTTIAVP